MKYNLISKPCTHPDCPALTHHPTQLCEEHRLTARGIDWAYERLTRKAALGDKDQVRELARLFRPEVLDDCLGMALCDIDWPTHPKSSISTYKMVRDVCRELLEGK